MRISYRTGSLSGWIVVAIAMLACHPAHAQEWTRFRGPNGSGIGVAPNLPSTWTESDINWRADLPGIGHSSPVLWGDKVFLTSAIEDTCERIVFCVDAKNGQVLWERRFPSTVHPKHDRNSFASATPCVDEEHVYVVWSAPEAYSLRAFHHDGTDAWSRDLGPYISQHSCGSSPIVYEDMVVLSNDQDRDGTSFLIALDRKTGETRWQTGRNGENVAYSTPCVYQPEGKPAELIFNSGAHGISSINPQDGKVNWELDVLDKRSVSSPVIGAGLIFGSTGSGGGGHYVVAVRPGTSDGSVKPELAYRIDNQAPYVPTVLAKGDLVFLFNDKGVVSCLRASDGEMIWRERAGAGYSGSPVCVDDRLFCIDDYGSVLVLSATEKFKTLAKNELGEDSRSTPAVANGRMYLRTYTHLISVGGGK